MLVFNHHRIEQNIYIKYFYPNILLNTTCLNLSKTTYSVIDASACIHEYLIKRFNMRNM